MNQVFTTQYLGLNCCVLRRAALELALGRAVWSRSATAAAWRSAKNRRIVESFELCVFIAGPVHEEVAQMASSLAFCQ